MAGVSCRACGDGQPGTPAWGDGESCPGGGRSVLQGLWGRRTGHTGLGGRGVQPKGWSEFPAGSAGMDNRAHRPGGIGSPARGVVGVSCRACGDGQLGPPAWGDGESRPAGGRSFLQGLRGWTTGPRGRSERPAGPAGMDNRARRLGGTGSPAKGVVGASCRACGGVEPGTPARGDGESSPAGGRSLPQGLRGWTTGPRGRSERPAGPVGA